MQQAAFHSIFPSSLVCNSYAGILKISFKTFQLLHTFMNISDHVRKFPEDFSKKKKLLDTVEHATFHSYFLRIKKTRVTRGIFHGIPFESTEYNYYLEQSIHVPQHLTCFLECLKEFLYRQETIIPPGNSSLVSSHAFAWQTVSASL